MNGRLDGASAVCVDALQNVELPNAALLHRSQARYEKKRMDYSPSKIRFITSGRLARWAVFHTIIKSYRTHTACIPSPPSPLIYLQRCVDVRDVPDVGEAIVRLVEVVRGRGSFKPNKNEAQHINKQEFIY